MQINPFLKKKKSILITIIVFILLIIIVFLINSNYKLLLKKENFDQDNLKKEVFSIVKDDIVPEHNGSWNEEIELKKIFPSYKAVQGIWWGGNGADNWISWKENNGSWKILISYDGYDCFELETIPKEYEDFFHEQIYMFSSNNQKYCYNHSSNNK